MLTKSLLSLAIGALSLGAFAQQQTPPVLSDSSAVIIDAQDGQEQLQVDWGWNGTRMAGYVRYTSGDTHFETPISTAVVYITRLKTHDIPKLEGDNQKPIHIPGAPPFDPLAYKNLKPMQQSAAITGKMDWQGEAATFDLKVWYGGARNGKRITTDKHWRMIVTRDFDHTVIHSADCTKTSFKALDDWTFLVVPNAKELAKFERAK